MPIIGNKDTLIVKLAFQKWEKWLVPVLWQSPRLFWEVVGYFLFLSQRKLPSCKSHLKVLGILKTNKSIVYILPKTSLFYKGCFESYFSLSEKTVTMLLIFGKLANYIFQILSLAPFPSLREQSPGKLCAAVTFLADPARRLHWNSILL